VAHWSFARRQGLMRSGGIGFAVALRSLTTRALRCVVIVRSLCPCNRPVASIRVLSTFVAVVADRCRIGGNLRAANLRARR
jgi:hypothetical protein